MQLLLWLLLLLDEERLERDDVVVVLGESDKEAFARDLEATAARHLELVEDVLGQLAPV